MAELADFHSGRTADVPQQTPCSARLDGAHVWRLVDVDKPVPHQGHCVACGQLRTMQDVLAEQAALRRAASLFETSIRATTALDLSPRTLLEYLTMPTDTLPDDIKKATVKLAFDMAEEELDEETPEDERHDPERLVTDMLLDVWTDYCREPYISLCLSLYEDSYAEFRQRMTGGGPTTVS